MNIRMSKISEEVLEKELRWYGEVCRMSDDIFNNSRGRQLSMHPIL